MIYITIFLVVGVYSMNISLANVSNKICKCKQYSTQQTCQVATYCIWKYNQCNNNIICSSAQNAASCQLINNMDTSKQCVWRNNSCSDFIQCSDYSSASTKADCFGVGCFCYSLPCICTIRIASQTCSSFDNELSCFGQIQDDLFCVWKSGACIVPQSCDDIPGNICPFQQLRQACTGYNGCSMWSRCDYYRQNQCQSYYTLTGFQKYYVSCIWNGSRCIDTDFQTLGESDCLLKSLFTYTYDRTKQLCVSCSSLPTDTSSTQDQQPNSTSQSNTTTVNSTSSSNTTAQTNSTTQSGNQTSQNTTNNTISNTTAVQNTTLNTTTNNTTTNQSTTSLLTVQQIFSQLDKIILNSIAEQNKNLTRQIAYLIGTMSFIILI